MVDPKEYKKEMKNYVDSQEALYRHLKTFFDEKCEMMYRIAQRIDITKREIDITPDENQRENPPVKTNEETSNVTTGNVIPDINRFQTFETHKQAKMTDAPIESKKEESANPLNFIVETPQKKEQDSSYPSIYSAAVIPMNDTNLLQALGDTDLSNQTENQNQNIANNDKMEMLKEAKGEINQTQLEEVHKSINEYGQAIEYLKEVKFENQLQRMEKKKTLLEKMKFCIQNGKTFDFSKANIHLTPFEIIGIDESQRKNSNVNEEFDEVINLLRQRVDIFKERAAFFLEEFKKQVNLISQRIIN